ncbi:MAG: hypothetical protein ACLFTZ_00445 [Acholeplasmataceae bacterium]
MDPKKKKEERKEDQEDRNEEQDDDREATEEELKAFIDQLRRAKRNKNWPPLALSFLIHPNYLVHMALSFVVNLLVAAVVIGFAESLAAPLASVEPVGFLLAFGLLTLLENFFKILLYRYFLKVMLMSMGMISLVVLILILYTIDAVLTTGFSFERVENLIFFAILFSILRFFIVGYLRRFLNRSSIYSIKRR